MKRYLLFTLLFLLFAFSITAFAAGGTDGPLTPLEKAGYLLTDFLQSKTNAIDDMSPSTEDASQLDDIIVSYDEAIRQHPGDVTAYAQRAFAFSLIQDYKRAIEDYSVAISLNPWAADLYKNRAINYERVGNLEAALRDYEKFASLIAHAPTERRKRERLWVNEKIHQIMTQTGLRRTPDSELPKLTPPQDFIPENVPVPNATPPPPIPPTT